MATENNNNNTSPEKKNDKNPKIRFNSNWIFAILAISFILFEVMLGGKSPKTANAGMLKDMIVNHDIEKIIFVCHTVAFAEIFFLHFSNKHFKEICSPSEFL